MSRKVSGLDEVHPLDCPVVAQVRVAYADCAWFYDRGYIRYYDGTKSMLREHQRVAQMAYGLPDDYHVHHIDRNRVNNCADNLAVLSPAEHLRLHGQAYRSRLIVTCPICETPFESHAYRVLNRNAAYCGDACRSFADRKVDRPSVDALATLIREVNNWSALGRMFGVSDNAVRKWAKTYGLL